MKIAELEHPDYSSQTTNWTKYRLIMQGGEDFIEEYCKQFSSRELALDFYNRKLISYAPCHAKAAINKINHSIYQRMSDIRREGGTDTYQRACLGENFGVDLAGSSMNAFIGKSIISELTAMGRVGVFIDRLPMENAVSVYDASQVPIYLYAYKTENIISWRKDRYNRLTHVVLIDYVDKVDEETGLVKDVVKNYRFLYIENDKVIVNFYDESSNIIDSMTLDINRIPMVIFELNQSLLTDIADYQIALLNLASSDMNYAMKSNFPFYTEQYAPHAGDWLRKSEDGTQDGASTADTRKVNIGAASGRRYPQGLERPAFIHPSPDPLRVSMEKQEILKKDILELIDLGLTTTKSVSSNGSGLEEGLSSIGIELETGERNIAEIWALYEGRKDVINVKYPTNYSLRSDVERREEAKELQEIGPKVPSISFQRALAKEVTNLVIGSKITRGDLEEIYNEIDSAVVITTDPNILKQDHEAGFVSTKTASIARGYPEGEVEQAKLDHAERARRIALAQSSIKNPASRGVVDLASEPEEESKREKTLSQDADVQDDQKKGVRGKGNAIQ